MSLDSHSLASNPRVYFEVEIGGKKQGRIVMELFKNVTPRTAENFRQLCTGEAGSSKMTGKPLNFRNSIFHRVIKGFMMQGGDFTKFNGTGGESIYGTKFADENFKLQHTQRGLLSMANAGKNTNGSQFFITFCPTKHLNSKHVVFGRVEKGYEICEKVERLPVGADDKPREKVVIVACGEIKAEKKEEKKKEETAVHAKNPEVKAKLPEVKEATKATESPAKTGEKHRPRSDSGKSIDSEKKRGRETTPATHDGDKSKTNTATHRRSRSRSE